jgi:thiol-disulfide isomerase/thioredoxin
MLTVLTLVSRIVLAAVFAIAGATKLADRAGTRQGMVGFGAPEWLAGTLALGVPLAELAVAGLVLPAGTAVYGAIGALALLAVFSAAIGWNLAHGRAPDCHCFGQLHSEPASWRTLARNAALAAIAVIALVGSIAEPVTSATAWIGDLNGTELLALAVAVAAVGLLVTGALAFLTLMRSYGRVLVRLDRLEASFAEAGFEIVDDEPQLGLKPGSAVPEFAATTLDGQELTPSVFAVSGLPTMLLFTSPRCAPCASLLPDAAGWQRELADELAIVLVSDGSPEEVRAEADEHALESVVIDKGGRLYEAFEASGTPSAVLIAADGTIASWIAAGSERIQQLVGQAVATDDEVEGLPIGTEAPTLDLPTLDGESTSLAELRGRDTLLLFWNPDCGFCREMHDDLLAWETSTDGDTPRLVVISSGDAESSRNESFRSRVLLDEDFSAGAAFHATGTPMAVLIDAEGRIASSVVGGADAVLALANGHGLASAGSGPVPPA